MSTSTTAARTAATAPPRPWPSGWPAWRVFPRLGVVQTAPGNTRASIRTTLAQWGMAEFSETAELLSSELVTNVVDQVLSANGTPRHPGDGRTPTLQVGLFTDLSSLVIAVLDELAQVPLKRDSVPELDEGGRGLFLAAALGKLGWYSVPGGKIVHVTLTAESIA